MKHFFRGGEGMAVGQGDKVTKLQSDRGLSSGPKSINDRLLRCTRSDEQEMERSDEGGESLRTTFGLASPLLRPYITDSSRIQHRFNTSESRIVDEKVIKRCSGGNKTPKLVRSRYESDQEPVGHQDYQLSSSQVLPLFCLCSTSPRSGRDRAVTWLRSFIGASSQTHQSAIEAPSENGRTRLGPGRDLVGSFSAYPLPRGRSFSGLEPSGYQRTGKERADKYQAKPKASPEMEQRSSKEQAENKQRISKASVWSFNTLLIHCYYLAHTWGILRRYTKKASAWVAGWFGMASRLARTSVQTGSTAVRQLFEFCSAVSRRGVEALSKVTRRRVEDFPNPSRSDVEDFPKSSRRIAEAEEARTKVELGLRQPKTRVELGMNYQTAKDELGMSLERTGEKEEDCFIVVPPIRNDGSDVCSDGIGSRNDGEVVEDLREKRLILRGFRKLCEEFRSKVEPMLVGEKIKRERGLNRVFRHCAAFRPVGNRNEMERSNLKGVTVDNLWSRLLRQARSDGRIKLSRYDDIKRPKAYSLQLITLLCVLFSSLVGVQAVAQVQSGSSLVGVVSSAVDGRTIGGTGAQGSHRPYDFSLYGAVEVRLLTRTQQVEGEKRRYPKVDFNKFPIEIFKVDADRIPKLQVGQLLPDAVLDMPLRVVNDVYGRDTVTLRSCMDRRWIILDIWSESCIPCLASMNHWEELSKTDQSFTLLGVYHSFYTHRAMPETRKKDYRSTQIIGPATAILSRLFLQAKGRLGPTVWIKDGRFFGVSEANTLRDEDYRLLLDGKLNAIPEYALWKPITY